MGKVHRVLREISNPQLLSISQAFGSTSAEETGWSSGSSPSRTMVTPSASHWLINVNAAAGRDVFDLGDTESHSIARAYVGIVTYREIAECLGWPNREIGYASAMGDVLVVAIMLILSVYLVHQFRQGKEAKR